MVILFSFTYMWGYFFDQPNFMLPGGSIRKEVIFDLQGENQFLS
jgi:hypothetical protein